MFCNKIFSYSYKHFANFVKEGLANDKKMLHPSTDGSWIDPNIKIVVLNQLWIRTTIFVSILYYIYLYLYLYIYLSIYWNLIEAESTTNYRVKHQRKLCHRLCNTPSEKWRKKTGDFIKMTSDGWRMILFLSIKYTIYILIIRYIVYDNNCLMVRKINYFIYYFFLYRLWIFATGIQRSGNILG